jgi:hypothetical protein
MKKSPSPRAGIPGHVIALCALAAVAALFAYALYDRANPGRTVTPAKPRAAAISHFDAESWTRSQQKVLGTRPGRFTVEQAAAAPAPDFTAAERPITRTVTHVGVAPRRAEAPRWSKRAASNYAGPSLASLPPPGD